MILKVLWKGCNTPAVAKEASQDWQWAGHARNHRELGGLVVRAQALREPRDLPYSQSGQSGGRWPLGSP